MAWNGAGRKNQLEYRRHWLKSQKISS